jgi:hypothetical protein
MIPFIYGVIFAVYLFGGAGVISIGVGIAVGLVGAAAWYYSPLPDHNGGFGMPPAKWQQWGWTSEPRGEYEDADSEDVMQPALGLLPVNMADRKGGDAE